MADEIKISISAKDGASKVFADVGKSASTMSTEVSNAGTGFDSMGKSASTASGSLKDFSAAGTQIGTGLAALAVSFGIYSQSVIDNDRNVANLGRTYGDAADSFKELADQLQDTTIFSNDEVIQAANSFGTLARNYGLTTDQIQELIRVSADLAAVNGVSLIDAATRVQAAIRGEGESAEALGLTMNQAAIDTGNLTLTMSNAEAGQFRYNAILKQAAFAQGAAGEQANTTAGKMEQLANKVQDGAQAFVDFTGPVGPAVAGLSSFGLEAGLALTGIIQLGRGVSTAATALGGFSTILGTGGLVLAAGLAVYGVIKLSDALDSGFNDAMASAEQTTTDLDAAISSLTTSLGDAQTALAFQGVDSGLDQTVKDLERVQELQKEIAAGGDFSDHTNEGIINTVDANSALQDELDGLTAKYGDLTAAAQNATGAQEDLASILTHTSAGAEEARNRALELSQQFNTGAISLEEYAFQLNWITEHFANYDEAALSAAASTATLAEEAKSLEQISKDAYDAAVAVGVLDSSLEKMRAAGLNTPSLNISSNIDGAALSNTFDVLVKGSQALADSAADVAKWGNELAVAGEGVSKLKTLFDNGSISLETYNAALQANTEIQTANASIQNDIAAIQANQLPIMAELTEQQAAYIDQLAHRSAQEQLVALGYLDAAESAKALELATLAANAASGQLGDTGEATATKIITAAANADPVMKAMLEDMNLITTDKEGNITVNFPNASDLNTAVENLSASIDDLTAAISNIPVVHTDTNAADTQIGVDNLTGSIYAIPDSHNTTITATDAASGTIANIKAQLDSIPAYTSAVVAVSVQQSGTLPAGAAIGGRLGGVMGYANGGMVTASLAEVGMELARFSNGGEALIPNPGLYSIPVGTNILPAPATKAEMSRRGGGGDIYINTIQIIAQNGDLEGMLRSEALRLARQR